MYGKKLKNVQLEIQQKIVVFHFDEFWLIGCSKRKFPNQIDTRRKNIDFDILLQLEYVFSGEMRNASFITISQRLSFRIEPIK